MRRIHVHQEDDKVSPALSHSWEQGFAACGTGGLQVGKGKGGGGV